jgi:hypothetical protein
MTALEVVLREHGTWKSHPPLRMLQVPPVGNGVGVMVGVGVGAGVDGTTVGVTVGTVK